MHPKDEAEFVRTVSTERGTVFVDGPRWSSPGPPATTDIKKCDTYVMIWNTHETPFLSASHYRNEDAEWWYCDSEFWTIQFLRSGFQFGEPYLFEGRIAISTTDKSGVF